MAREVIALYISPTGNTKKAVKAVAKGIADKLNGGDFFAIDITPQEARKNVYEFGEEDIVVIGCPTYAGRVPNKLMPYLRESVFGLNTPSVAVVTYGNRAYDNSLKELTDIMLCNDFDVMNAVAVPAEHAFSQKLAAGRPDEVDTEQLVSLGNDIADAIMKGEQKHVDYDEIPGEDVEQMTYYTPLKEDEEAAAFLKAMPITDTEKCKGCRECVYVCPMNCYMNSVSEPEGICIKCQGCVKACPEGAKYFSNEDFVSHVRYLEKNYADENKEIEIY